MGATEFLEWSDRIIAGAMVSADKEDQRYALADMIMHLGPNESFKCDAHFIHYLRKVAVNQVAFSFMEQHRAKKKPTPEQVLAAQGQEPPSAVV